MAGPGPRGRFLVAAILGPVAAGLFGAAPALADPLGPASTMSAPASVAGGHPFAVRASLVQARGALFPAGVAVIFSQVSGPDPGCVVRFDSEFTVTDATGVASAQVTLPPGCPGRYVLSATAAGSGTLSVTLAETGGFPNTSADPPRGTPGLVGDPGGKRYPVWHDGL